MNSNYSEEMIDAVELQPCNCASCQAYNMAFSQLINFTQDQDQEDQDQEDQDVDHREDDDEEQEEMNDYIEYMFYKNEEYSDF